MEKRENQENNGNKIKVIIFNVGEKPFVKDIDVSNNNELHKIVGGYIETLTLLTGLIVVCNEEGKIQGLPINRIVYGEPIAGNFLLCRSKGSEFSSVTEADIKEYVIE